MLRDDKPTYNLPKLSDLSVKSNYEVSLILGFIDQNISAFPPFFLNNRDSDRENRISDFLVYYFNLCLRNEPYRDFPSFSFGKNPTQASSGQETDIGVVVLTKSVKPITIIEFEAKRLSDSSNNKEYVCGSRGGIERFKRGEHASHLTICGMFGYVQKRSLEEWIQKVNIWIDELSMTNMDSNTNWSNSNEKLRPIASFEYVEKLESLHSRIGSLNPLIVYHYFIKLY